MLEGIQNTLIAIRKQLLSDKIIRKLIFNDSNNALNMDVPLLEECKKYITLKPIYQFENKKDYEQNTMINIFLTDGQPLDEEVGLDGVIQINVVVNIDKWDLLDDKIRPIELSNRIIKILNNKKFITSNPLSFSSITQLIINKQLVGYALLFNIVDGNGSLDNY